ncbi:hypothetical protein [Nocardia sp. NPDC046763]|uniref:hypothetical protein n=1 Tax=Nocardia sp. NPDC046763 TaxID=3155256 RepID=UPI0033EFCDE3
MAHIETGNGGAVDQGLVDQGREPCPHNIVGPGKGSIEGGLIDGAGMHPIAPGLPFRDQSFVHTQVGGELPDTHAFGIAEGPGLFA